MFGVPLFASLHVPHAMGARQQGGEAPAAHETWPEGKGLKGLDLAMGQRDPILG